MPLDTTLLYGEMLGSAIMHIAIPFAVLLIIQVMRSNSSLIYLALCVGASFLVQLVFLLILQANACRGIKNFAGVAYGALIAALITCGMVAIPIFIESMRHMVSQLFIEHQVLLTPELRAVHDIIAKAGTDIQQFKQAGGSLSEEDYDKQTNFERAMGTSYWAAFAGAYGVAFGSLMAGTCSGASGP